MPAVRYLDTLYEKALRLGRAYDESESRLKGVFKEGLLYSICLSMRKFWGANEGATLTRYATFVFKLQHGYSINSMTSHVEDCRRKITSKNNIWERCPTAKLRIANEHSIRFSSSFEEAPMKVLGRLKRRSHASKMSKTPQEQVASITPRIQEPWQ